MWILGGIVVLQVTASSKPGDAHPQQPFTIIYGRLRKRVKRRGKKGESASKGGVNERFFWH